MRAQFYCESARICRDFLEERMKSRGFQEGYATTREGRALDEVDAPYGKDYAAAVGQ